MDCEQTAWASEGDYLRAFNRKAAQLRVPLTGGIEITRRCNLRCGHCYQGHHTGGRGEGELTTGQWLTLIDEITDAGCLYLLITGGEPLFRADFKTIYRHAKTNGLLVTVFTNGTLVDDDMVDFFTRYPPRIIEISLYGAGEESYQRITGKAGAFERCLRAVEGLADMKINVRLKTLLMRANRDEFSRIETFARAHGVKFRFDPALFPRFDGDRGPVNMRVTAEEAVEKEFSDDRRRREYRDFFADYGDLPPSDALYRCGAGLTHFHIGADGDLRPCLMVKQPSYSLISGHFRTGWDRAVASVRNMKLPPDHRCIPCNKRILCGFCPGFFELETGGRDCPPDFLCELGQRRFEKIKEMG